MFWYQSMWIRLVFFRFFYFDNFYLIVTCWNKKTPSCLSSTKKDHEYHWKEKQNRLWRMSKQLKEWCWLTILWPSSDTKWVFGKSIVQELSWRRGNQIGINCYFSPRKRLASIKHNHQPSPSRLTPNFAAIQSPINASYTRGFFRLLSFLSSSPRPTCQIASLGSWYSSWNTKSWHLTCGSWIWCSTLSLCSKLFIWA